QFQGNKPLAIAEKRYIKKNGEVLWARRSSVIIKDRDGKPAYSVGTVEDITERKRAEEALQASEARLRKIFEVAPVGVTIVDNSTLQWQMVNPKFCQMLGYTEEELLSMRFTDLTHPDDRKRDAEAARMVLEGEVDAVSADKRFIRKDGELIWVSRTASAFPGEDGRPRYAVALIEDITERKRAEEALRESEERFRRIFEESPLGIFIVDSNRRIVEVNKKFCEMVEYSREELEGRSSAEITHPDDIEDDNENLRSAFGGRKASPRKEKRFIKKNGEVIWVVRTGSMLHGTDGRPMYAMAMVEDVTERKRNEEALRESEERFRKIFEDSPLGMVIVDKDRRYLEVNDKFCQMLGYKAEELKGRQADEFTHPDDIERGDRDALLAFGGKVQSVTAEKRYIRKDGEIIWVSRTGSVVRGPDGEPLYGIAMMEDISERKWTEEALRQSEERFRKIFEESPLGMVIVDKDRRYLDVNPKLCEVLGYEREELIGRNSDSFSDPEDVKIGQEQIRRGFDKGYSATFKNEKRFYKKNGETIWVNRVATVIRDADGKPLYGLAMMEDTTERKRIEEELRRVNQQLEEERAAIKKLNQSLEEKVKQRTAELERSYRELQERTQQFLSAKSEALSDGLTGLGNHRALQERVRQEVAKAQQTGGSVGLIMLDIDGFKNINDTLGHQAGDDILRELSQQITAVVPAGDAYRYGGDEFAIIARNVNSKETAKLAEELRKLVETRIQVNGGTATISLGIASFPEDAQSAETLIYGADSAMYAAKSAGKNRVGIWSLTASKS
ncbi:MAG TPA: PAS domain S-box protein, partial [Dehalococcoidia bacterium]|nr:PAS domain S-box protein [Dehalococcoidia bacterium]